MPIEKQLLPSKKLEPYYAKVTWLFVSRNFKKDLKDIVAMRSHDRFGVSSWPQMFVYDGRDDLVMRKMPRSLKAFIVGLDRTIAAYGKRQSQPKASAEELARQRDLAYQRTVELEALLAAKAKGGKLRDKDLDAAELDLLDADADIVVRLRALRLLAQKRPQTIVEHAPAWLATANDPWRYELLGILARSAKPAPALTRELVRLFEQAGKAVPSRNPNVLRMKVADCLAQVGDADALTALSAPALEANPRNGLTHTVIRAVGTIAARSKGKQRQQALDILSQSLPPAVTATGNDKATQLATRRALGVLRTTYKAITPLIGDATLPAPPTTWTESDRSTMQRTLQTLTQSHRRQRSISGQSHLRALCRSQMGLSRY